MKKRLFAVMLSLMLALGAAQAQGVDAETAARVFVPENAVLRETEIEQGVTELTFWDAENDAEYEVKLDDTNIVLGYSVDFERRLGGKADALTGEETQALLLVLFPGATVIDIISEKDEDGWEKTVYFYTIDSYGELTVNAETGETLELDVVMGLFTEVIERAVTTVHAARERLYQLKPGAKITELEEDNDDGKQIWEGEALLDGVEYEFEMDALTGLLIEWTVD